MVRVEREISSPRRADPGLAGQVVDGARSLEHPGEIQLLEAALDEAEGRAWFLFEASRRGEK